MTAEIIVTLATQRSGTKTLCSSFNKGDLVWSFGEVFHPQGESPNFCSFLYEKSALDLYTIDSVFRTLDEFFYCYLPKFTERSQIHVDVMYNNLGMLSPVWSHPGFPPDQSTLLKYMIQRKFLIVHLQRKELWQAYMSERIARHVGRFHSFAGEYGKNKANFPISLSIHDAMSYVEPIIRTRKFVEQFLVAYPNSLTLKYEELFDHNNHELSSETRRCIKTLLGSTSDSALGAPGIVKNADDKRDQISNFEDIRAAVEFLERTCWKGI